MYTINKDSKVIKILNNSSMIVEQDKQEFVLVGKGISFNKKPNMMMIINEKNIEKIFVFTKCKNAIQKVISNNENFPFVLDAMHILSDIIDTNQSEEALSAFCDHLSITYERVRMGEDLMNPFLYETKTLYSESFNLAKQLCQKLSDMNAIEIPEAEIGYIALHIQNINSNSSEIAIGTLNSLIFEIRELLEKKYHINLFNMEDAYGRFISHIKFLLTRILKHISIENQLLDVIEERYQDVYPMAVDIKNIIEQEVHQEINDHELSFIVIHMYRLIEK